MKEITRENAEQILKEREQDLRIVTQKIETFEDYSEICGCLRDIVKASDIVNEIDSGENEYCERFSFHTQDNLQTVSELLDICARLLSNCHNTP